MAVEHVQQHGLKASSFENLNDQVLVNMFNEIIFYLHRNDDACDFLTLSTAEWEDFVATLDRIARILTCHHWTLNHIFHRPEFITFFQESRQNLYTQHPHLLIEYH
jgi:hypothetical protein